MEQYLPLITLLALAILFATISVAVSRFLAPRNVTKAKTAPYECGILPSRETPERFPVRFFLVAMIFIIFDIEIIFLYPWAVIYQELGIFGLWEMVLFAVAVFAAFLYMVANGALDWGPVKRASRRSDSTMVGVHRTSETTVRRVGLEGRDVPAEREREGREAEPTREPVG
jgi:NADH-quinone oxidoreductase subunit A